MVEVEEEQQYRWYCYDLHWAEDARENAETRRAEEVVERRLNEVVGCQGGAEGEEAWLASDLLNSYDELCSLFRTLITMN